MKKLIISCISVFVLVGCGGNRPPVSPAPTPPSLPAPVGLNASYHGPLDAQTLEILASAPLVLRAAVATSEQANSIAASVMPFPSLRVLWLIETKDPVLAQAVAYAVAAYPVNWGIELGNELDLANVPPEEFGSFVTATASMLRANGWGAGIVSGGIYTTQPEALRYLTAAGVATWPSYITIGLHRYGNPTTPVDGYSTRMEENAHIREVVGSHNVAITEFGYVTRTPEEEASATKAIPVDLSWFGELGAIVATYYQYTDGPTNSNLDHFGVRAFDGRWKEQVKALGVKP